MQFMYHTAPWPYSSPDKSYEECDGWTGASREREVEWLEECDGWTGASREREVEWLPNYDLEKMNHLQCRGMDWGQH
jgi:hypothetical protein